VIVVDNGSTGGAAAAVGRAHGAQVVSLQENRGFAGGANAGIATAHGDVIALLNDDAIAGPSWLDGAARLLGRGDVAAVAPKLLLAQRFAEYVLDDDEHFAQGDVRPLGRQVRSASAGGREVLGELVGAGVHGVEVSDGDHWRWTAGCRPFYLALGDDAEPAELIVDGATVSPTRCVELVNSAGSYLRRDGYAGDCGADEPDDGQWNARRECFAASGAALVTTAAVLGKVGLLTPSYFAYYEDTEWCWRARLAGFSIWYEPTLSVRHVRGLTSGGTSAERVQFLAERNRLVTLARCAPLRVAFSEARAKRSGGGSDGVAEVLPKAVLSALGQRLAMRRRWKLSAREVFERWAGVDVP
jgi:GT2 family glycosyltransferase